LYYLARHLGDWQRVGDLPACRCCTQAGCAGTPFRPAAWPKCAETPRSSSTSWKVDWTPDPQGLVAHAKRVAEGALADLEATAFFDDLFAGMRRATPDRDRFLRTLPAEQERLLLKGSISPVPLHKALVLLEHIRRHHDELYFQHELLALANVLVFSICAMTFAS
jgi:hypothetical protein